MLKERCGVIVKDNEVWKDYVQKETVDHDRWYSDGHDPYSPKRLREEPLWQALREREALGSGPLALRTPSGIGPKVRPSRAALARANPPAPGMAPARFRMPAFGEPVRISGVRGKPELNGSCGEVVSNGPDAEGFIKVRLFGGAGDSAPLSEQVVKVRCERLLPVEAQRSMSSTNIRGSTLRASGGALLGAVDDCASCRTCSLADSRSCTGTAMSRTTGYTSVSSSSGGALSSATGLSLKWLDQRTKRTNMSYMPTASV